MLQRARRAGASLAPVSTSTGARVAPSTSENDGGGGNGDSGNGDSGNGDSDDYDWLCRELSLVAGQLLLCNCHEPLDDENNNNDGNSRSNEEEDDNDFDDNDDDGDDDNHLYPSTSTTAAHTSIARSLQPVVPPPVLVMFVKGIPRDCLLEVEVLAIPPPNPTPI